MIATLKEENETEDWTNQDFSQDDKDFKKKKAAKAASRQRYSTTKVKVRNFLTNIAYRRYKKPDFENSNFVIDVYSFLLQNLNPLMIDRKFDNDNDRQCIKTLWQKFMSRQFCRYIFLYDNFLALTQMEITYQKANAVVKEFLKRHPHKLNSLKENLAENAKIIQYIYATLFPKYYSRNNKFDMQNKSLVDLAYREWISNTAVEKNKEKLQLAKDPNNYSRSEKNISEF